MNKYVIERPLPGAGQLSAPELQGIAQTSNEVIEGMAGRVQWIQSYVTDDTIYCVYLGDDEESVREHARLGGFPAEKVSEVATIFDPSTADKTMVFA